MKHKSVKQILSLLLAMVMLIGLLPTAAFPVFAADLIGRNTISSVAITVDSPIAGEPLLNCVPKTTLCDITCTWSVRGLKGVTEVPATTIAKAGTIYYLAMVLTPKVDLYTFAASVTGTVNGNTVTVERMSSTRVACMVTVNPARPAGSGTEADPFRIGTAGELYWFEGFVNGDITDDDFTVTPSAACAQLTSNITLNDNLLDEAGQPAISDPKEWTPIGRSTAYAGTFDGQNYTISGIYYDPQTGSTSNEEEFGGLFGTIGAGGSVCNLTLEDSFLRSRIGVAYAYTGGITGVLELNGTVENCHFDGTVTTGDSEGRDGMGGIAAVNRGVIQNCTTKGMVYGFGFNVGGIAGYVYRKNGEGGEVNGCVNEATVGTTMKLDDSQQFATGGIVGSSMFGIIKDCCNMGDLPSVWHVGGIAGRIEGTNAAVIRCWNEGRIEKGYGAGIVSCLGDYATVENCYNAGEVSHAGIVALFQQGYNTISNCHNVGEVSNNAKPIGYTNISSVKFENCYYLGTEESDSVDGTTYKTAAEFAGGLVLFLLNAGDNAGNWKQGGAYPILDAVFTLTVNGGTGSGTYGVGTEVTITATVPDGMVFAGWDGIDGLIVEAGQPAEDSVCTTFLMPKRDVTLTAKFVSIAPTRPAGSGTEDDPFQIRTAGELYWFSAFVNKTITAPDLTVNPYEACAELMNDITVNDCLLTEDGARNGPSGFVEWIPIGLTAGYDGTFDGNGKTVSGIYCAPQDATKTYYGFFSHIDDGCVRNLTLVDSYFCAPAKNTAYTGGIAGQVYENGTVENCHFDGTVTTAITGDSENKESYTSLKIAGIAGSVLGEVRNCTVRGLISGYGRLVGGIAAYVNNGEVSGCVSEATVENTRSDTGYYYTGGIAAAIGQGTVRDCCNKSYVSSGWISAGIVCHVEDKGSTVSRCWNEGEIKKGSGIVCLLKGTVQNCYNTGKVEYGIVGQPDSGSSITYCHNVGEIPSYGSPIWGVFSSDVEMADCYYMADSETDEYDGTTYKTAAEFADGTVLALLDNGNWEQGDDYPVLAEPKGVTVSGTVTSFGSETDAITVELFAEGSAEAKYTVTIKGNTAEYSLEGVAAGTYTMKVSKKNHVTREYTVTVDGNVTQDVKICLRGDVTGDGKINMGDVSRAFAHVRRKNTMTDAYAIACADATGDGRLNLGDIAKLFAHARGTALLW